MNKSNKDIFTILNYQGSKKNLLNFIHENINSYIDPKKAILDICSGTASVAYSLKQNNVVYANDSELYSSIIAKALLQYNHKEIWESLKNEFHVHYLNNYENLVEIFKDYYIREIDIISKKDSLGINKLYEEYPVIWSNKKLNINGFLINSIEDLRNYKYNIPFVLFTTYYSTTYFGIKQSMEIDSIRYAIERVSNKNVRDMLLSSLYYAMKECVFSKDGHMAQPLDIKSNINKLFTVRKKSIYKYFIEKVSEFNSNKFILNTNDNKVFNMKLEDVLCLEAIKNNVGFIYADPPYTDMQYSRYYHLLNTVTLYDYDNISLTRGKLSKGLYREDRFQSPLSQKSKAKDQIKLLFKFCKDNKINLGLSYAYPRNPNKQAVNRYTMSIDFIIELANSIFGEHNVKVFTEEYEHSNNRNTKPKEVLEYLIVCNVKENK